MLSRTLVGVPTQTPRWQQSLQRCVTSVPELLAELELEPTALSDTLGDRTGFPLRVPREFVARMRRGDRNDPLLLQVLPSAEELEARPGYSDQPLAEEAFVRAPGLIQKYQGRALLLVAGACAIHCRYCFRRNFPYGDQHPWADDAEAALSVVRSDPQIHEVILSGGDPLLASDRRLAGLVDRLQSIEHVDTLRIHSRLPVVIPTRIDSRLCGWLQATRLTTVFVLHANHAKEVDSAVVSAVARLRKAGATVLNQAVLLAGINDSAAAQIALNRKLFAAGALPYYLHQLDRVRGASHFEVSDRRAIEILESLRQQLPGYLVPRLVREVPGAPSKVPVR